MNSPITRDTGWFKSTRSSAASDNCVQVRFTDTHVGVRDSKDPTAAPCRLSGTAWQAFLTRAKAGIFDLPR